MKRIIGLLALSVLLGGCGGGLFRGKTSGSGKVKVEKRSVGDFKAVNVSGAFEVEIVAQQERGVEVAGDDNLLALIRTDVKNGVLDVFNEKPISTNSKIRVRISVPQLDAVATSGAASPGRAT